MGRPRRIAQDDSAYPTILRDRPGDAAPACRYAPGDAALLRHRLLGLLCSTPGPGGLIIQTLDAIRGMPERLQSATFPRRWSGNAWTSRRAASAQ